MKKVFSYVVSFSKLITIAWLCIWIETIIFTQVATIFNFGDTSALMYINDNVVQIGLIICGFYFSTKCAENIAKGIESSLTEIKKDDTAELNNSEQIMDDKDFIDGPNGEYRGEEK